MVVVIFGDAENSRDVNSNRKDIKRTINSISKKEILAVSNIIGFGPDEIEMVFLELIK